MSGFLHNLARRTEPVTDLRPRLLSRFEGQYGTADQDIEQPSGVDRLTSDPVTPQLSFDQQKTLLVPHKESPSHKSVEAVTNLYHQVTHQQTVEQLNNETTTNIVQQPNDQVDARLATFERKLTLLNSPVAVPELALNPVPIIPAPDSSGNEQIDVPVPSDSPDIQQQRMKQLERQWAALRDSQLEDDAPSKTQADVPAVPHVTNVHNTRNLIQPERVVETRLASANSVPEVREPKPTPVRAALESNSPPSAQQPLTPTIERHDAGHTRNSDVRPTSYEPPQKVVAEQIPQADTDVIEQRLFHKIRRAVSSNSVSGQVDAGITSTPARSLQPEKMPAIRSAMTAQKTINVSIGRIEVRATSSAKAAVPASVAAPAPASKVMSLDEYLARRSSGGMA